MRQLGAFLCFFIVAFFCNRIASPEIRHSLFPSLGALGAAFVGGMVAVAAGSAASSAFIFVTRPLPKVWRCIACKKTEETIRGEAVFERKVREKPCECGGTMILN